MLFSLKRSKRYITFPCKGKIPCVADWNNLLESKHADSQNYGILCGAVKNLLVIDCDLICNKENKASLFNKPHGIAITVDYAKKPSDGLMTIMKKRGFKHPGILWLKMPLQSDDGNGFVSQKDKHTNNRISYVVGPGQRPVLRATRSGY